MQSGETKEQPSVKKSKTAPLAERKLAKLSSVFLTVP